MRSIPNQLLKKTIKSVKEVSDPDVNQFLQILSKSVRTTIERVFKKHFTVHHDSVDNTRTYIEVGGSSTTKYPVKVSLCVTSPRSYFLQPVTIGITKSGRRWVCSSIDISENPFPKGELNSLIKSALKTTLCKLSRVKQLTVETLGVCKLLGSRIPGSKFEDPELISKHFMKWSRKARRTKILPRSPDQYPVNFFKSTKAPEIIRYLVPVV